MSDYFYRRDGYHIILGRPSPLSPDFKSTVDSQTEAERYAELAEKKRLTAIMQELADLEQEMDLDLDDCSRNPLIRPDNL